MDYRPEENQRMVQIFRFCRMVRGELKKQSRYPAGLLIVDRMSRGQRIVHRRAMRKLEKAYEAGQAPAK